MIDYGKKFYNVGMQNSSSQSLIRFVAMTIGFLCVMGFLTILLDKSNLLVVAALVMAVTMVVALFYWPEPGTILVISAIYTNLAVIAYKFHGLPQILAASVSLLLCVPLAVYWFIRREKFIVDYTWLLMIGFLGALCASLLVSKRIDVAMEWVYTYLLEGLALYLIILNVIRSYATLRSVIWALLVSGALLGSITLFQEVTQTYGNNYFGLAQRNTENWEGKRASEFSLERDKVRLANRAGGPIGGHNRYAQIMLVLLPLGLFRFIDEKKKSLKFVALGLTILILCGMLLTYSRGAFLTMIMMVMIVTILRYIKVYQVLISITLLLLVTAIASPGYFSRMDSIRGVLALFTKDASVKADGATKGRVTEMLAAFNAFLDHPIVGVGPGQYSKFYSQEYMSDPEIAFKHIDKTRRAHTLYFELMAETGILGLVTFMAIVLYLMKRLWRLRNIFKRTNTEFANLATGFWLSIIGYLTSAIFLQLAYQRYYWLLLAFAGATVHILQEYANKPEEKIEPENTESRSLLREVSAI